MCYGGQVIGEIDEVIKTACWVGDCLLYTNSVNRLNYYVGGEIVTVAHLDRLVEGLEEGRVEVKYGEGSILFCITF